MTLKQFVKRHGTKRKAAAAIGVPETTLYRWLSGSTTPVGLYAEKLESLGVEL